MQQPGSAARQREPSPGGIVFGRAILHASPPMEEEEEEKSQPSAYVCHVHYARTGWAGASYSSFQGITEGLATVENEKNITRTLLALV